MIRIRMSNDDIEAKRTKVSKTAADNQYRLPHALFGNPFRRIFNLRIDKAGSHKSCKSSASRCIVKRCGFAQIAIIFFIVHWICCFHDRWQFAFRNRDMGSRKTLLVAAAHYQSPCWIDHNPFDVTLQCIMLQTIVGNNELQIRMGS